MTQLWALEPSYLVRFLDTILSASAEDVKAATDFGAGAGSEIFTVEGSVAKIAIGGPLTQAGPTPLARFFGFGGTGYGAILEALAEAKRDSSVLSVQLDVNSPGGEVQGVDAVYGAVAELAKTKKVFAVNQGMMASAAYWLSAGASEILASSPGAETGSIGLQVTAIDTSEAAKRAGVKRVRIVSRSAPNKNPDVSTEAGREALQDRVDALERVFISRIAEGRGTTAENVENTFGRGAVLIAQDPDPKQPDAISVGMIDRVLGAGESAGDAQNQASVETIAQIEDKTGDTADLSPTVIRSNGPVSAPLEPGADASKEGNEMDIKTLADAVEQVPAIAAEIDQIKTDARAEVQSRIDAASPYLTSEYPEAIKTLAIGVLKGDKNPAALEGAVVALDAMTESNKVAAAADETTAQGDTPAGSGPTQPSADGTIATEEQYAAEVAQFRSAHGQEG